MPFSQETRLAPPFPSASQFRCPKCGRANASLDHLSSLELGSVETPSCCCCSSCGFVFDDGAGGIVGDGDAGGNWGSRSAAYGGGFSRFDSMGEIVNGIRDNAGAGNWVSEDGTVAGARYRGNATRYALPRPKHAAAFAKLAALCGKVSAPRAVAESAKAMLRAVLSEQSAAAKGKASSSTVAAKTTPSPPPPPPPLPALPHTLLGGACLLLAARRDRAPLFPADVAAALAVEPLRLARAAAAVAEAARAFSEGSAAPVGAEAFLRRALPGLVRGSSSWATASGGSGAAAAAGFPSSSASFPSSSSPAAAAVAAASAQTLEDALTLARWVEAGACPVECPAHGPTLAAGASVLAAAGRGVRLGSGGGDGDNDGSGLAVVAAAFRLASAADVARSEAALRRGLCRLAAARLPWLRKIRAKDVEGHARALLAAAREATAEAEERRRRHEEEEVRLRAAAAANKEGGDDALASASAAAAKSAAAVGPCAEEEAQREREDEEEEDELAAAAVIREEDWGLYLRRPEEVALAEVEFAAREKREAEAEAEAEAEGREENGVATPVQRPRKRACFVK